MLLTSVNPLFSVYTLQMVTLQMVTLQMVTLQMVTLQIVTLQMVTLQMVTLQMVTLQMVMYEYKVTSRYQYICYTSFKISSGNRSNTLFVYVMIVSQRHLSLYTLRYHSYIHVCPEHSIFTAPPLVHLCVCVCAQIFYSTSSLILLFSVVVQYKFCNLFIKLC